MLLPVLFLQALLGAQFFPLFQKKGRNETKNRNTAERVEHWSCHEVLKNSVAQGSRKKPLRQKQRWFLSISLDSDAPRRNTAFKKIKLVFHPRFRLSTEEEEEFQVRPLSLNSTTRYLYPLFDINPPDFWLPPTALRPAKK